MDTFEQYMLDEGLKSALKKFNQTLSDFASAKNLDLDFDVIRAHIDTYILRTREQEAMLHQKKSKDLSQLEKLSKKLKKVGRSNSLKDRAALGKLQLEFEPVLKKMGVRHFD